MIFGVALEPAARIARVAPVGAARHTRRIECVSVTQLANEVQLQHRAAKDAAIHRPHAPHLADRPAALAAMRCDFCRVKRCVNYVPQSVNSL